MTRIKNPDLSRPFPTYPGVFDLSRPSATKIDLFRPVGVGKFWSVSYVGGGLIMSYLLKLILRLIKAFQLCLIHD